MTDLTEQYRKGELHGEYWCEVTKSPYPEQVYLPTCEEDLVVKVLAKVPSYEEYTKLKGLLKVCRKWIGVERDFAVPNEKIILQQLLTKIDEVLK